MRLYKYTKFDIAKQIITSSQISLSQPQSFNDPFDCIPVWNESDINKAIDILNGYVIDQKIFETFKELKEKSTNPFQRALISFGLWEYEFDKNLAKKKSKLYFPIFSFKRFDKIVCFCGKMSKLTSEQLKAKENIDNSQARVELQEKQILTKMFDIRDSIYVACFSSVFDSILM